MAVALDQDSIEGMATKTAAAEVVADTVEIAVDQVVDMAEIATALVAMAGEVMAAAVMAEIVRVLAMATTVAEASKANPIVVETATAMIVGIAVDLSRVLTLPLHPEKIALQRGHQEDTAVQILVDPAEMEIAIIRVGAELAEVKKSQPISNR